LRVKDTKLQIVSRPKRRAVITCGHRMEKRAPQDAAEVAGSESASLAALAFG